MNYGQRLASYEGRGFRSDAAATNVLIEAALEALFSHFPERFVFIGGASLVLFYGSQRHSADLDLWLSAEAPGQEEIIAVLQPVLKEVAEALGYPNMSVGAVAPLGDVAKFSVRSGATPLFTIDLTKIGAVIKSEVVSLPLPTTDQPISIPVPSRNLTLLFKAEAFLTRKRLKSRDAFDIKLLLDSGATLTEVLKIHLADGPAADRVEDSAYIAKRISQVNAAICRPELEPFLQEDVYRELEQLGFQPLRDALTTLFSEWL
jgi:hypothetical protein